VKLVRPGDARRSEQFSQRLTTCFSPNGDLVGGSVVVAIPKENVHNAPEDFVLGKVAKIGLVRFSGYEAATMRFYEGAI